MYTRICISLTYHTILARVISLYSFARSTTPPLNLPQRPAINKFKDIIRASFKCEETFNEELCIWWCCDSQTAVKCISSPSNQHKKSFQDLVISARYGTRTDTCTHADAYTYRYIYTHTSVDLIHLKTNTNDETYSHVHAHIREHTLILRYYLYFPTFTHMCT